MYEQIFIIAKVFISELNVLQKKPSKQKQCLSFDFWQNYIELYVVKTHNSPFGGMYALMVHYFS